MINSYPSIYNLGHRAITDLFKGPVNIEEKVDGSQFSFMKDGDGNLHFRSKGQTIHAEAPEKLFAKAVLAVQEVDKAFGIPAGLTFRGEYLSKPKHNTLCYERIPSQHVIIFDIDDGNEGFSQYEHKAAMAKSLGLEVVPLLFSGMVTDPEALRALLETQSVLGGQKIEGMVIKPQAYDLFGRDKHVLMGKFVSEAFKETHGVEWKSKKTPGNNDIMNILTACYATEARWGKAVSHLRDQGTLLDDPKDIGPLMAEVPMDVLKECEDEIREKLFKWAWPQLRRTLTRGLSEWYKGRLLDKQFQRKDAESTVGPGMPVQDGDSATAPAIAGELPALPTNSGEPDNSLSIAQASPPDYHPKASLDTNTGEGAAKQPSEASSTLCEVGNGSTDPSTAMADRTSVHGTNFPEPVLASSPAEIGPTIDAVVTPLAMREPREGNPQEDTEKRVADTRDSRGGEKL